MKHTVTRTNAARLGAATLFGLVAVACGNADAGEANDSGVLTAEQREEVTDILRARGVDVNTLRIVENGSWLLEEDILLNPQDVLAGTAFRQDKGYAHNPASPPGSIISLTTNPAYPLSGPWLQAFLVAIADYTSHTNVTFGTGPGARVLEVRQAPLPIGSTDPLLQALWGCTKGYADGNGLIVINSTYNCPGPINSGCGATSIDALPTDEKIQTATHELGHHLGLMHPWEGTTSNHIPGTAVFQWAPAYASVMYWGCPQQSATDHIVKNLSADDINSLNTLYP